MSSPGDRRALHAALARMFLEEAGLAPRLPPVAAGPTDEEFGRLAQALGLVGASALRAAREEVHGRPMRLDERLQALGAIDADDVVAVYRAWSRECALPEHTVGPYFVLEPIGEGASGRVYRAVHRLLRTEVALKVLRASSTKHGDAVERFRREARAAAHLRHPGLVEVRDVGSDGELHFIAMEYVRGETLGEWLARAPSHEERMLVLEKVADAVGHAHGHGVVHRDLKPANIVLRDGREPVVVDFGLARLDDELTVTRSGAVLGTPRYMAPEQLAGGSAGAGPAADVFALGVLLFEASNGRVPFAGDDLESCRAGRTRPAASSDAPRPYAEIAARALEFDPRDRYADARELAEDLRRAREGEPVRALARTPLSVLRRGLRRRAVPLTVLGSALVVLVVVVLLREENARLLYAGHVKSAHHQLAPRLAPILARFEADGTTDPASRERFLADSRAVFAAVEDDTGVEAAYDAWTRHAAGDPAARSAIETARTRHPDNPFPALVSAWCSLSSYALAARWPLPGAIELNTAVMPAMAVAPRETPAMRADLELALRDLSIARGARIWEEVPELAWVGDLAAGFEAYAAGDDARAVEHLERAAAWGELAIEPRLLAVFARVRLGEHADAFHAAQRLHADRPGHAGAARALAACHAQRAAERLRGHRDGLEEVLAAEALLAPLAGVEPEHALLAVSRAVARARRGEPALADYERAVGLLDELLGRDPDDVGLLSNRAQCLMQLALAAREPSDLEERAVRDANRAVELQPDHVIARSNAIGIRLVALQRAASARRATVEAVRALEAEIEQTIARAGRRPSLLFYAASARLVEISLLERAGEGARGVRAAALAELEEAVALDPTFLDAHYMLVWTSLFPESRDALDLTALARRFEPFATTSASAERAMDAEGRMAGRLESLARTMEPASATALTRMALRVRSSDPAPLAREPVRAFARALTRLRLHTLDASSPKETLWTAALELDVARGDEVIAPDALAWRSLALACLGDLGGTADLGPDECARRARSDLDASLPTRPPLTGLLEAKFLFEAGEADRAQEVLAALEPSVRTPEREAAALLNSTSWRIVRALGAAPASYARALAAARVACAVRPDDAAYLNTLGIACYRNGEYAEALAVLERAGERNELALGRPHPADVAFQALSALELGRGDVAHAAYDLLEPLASEARFATDPDVARFVREVRDAFARSGR